MATSVKKPFGLMAGLALSLFAWSPQPAHGCAIKHNEVAIVLGIADNEPVVLWLEMHKVEVDEATSRWAVRGTLRKGSKELHSFGKLGDKQDPTKELPRWVEAARKKASSLVTGMVDAKPIKSHDCSSAPRLDCGTAALEDSGKTLRVETARRQLNITVGDLTADQIRIVGTTRYRAGDTEIEVVNVGGGDPSFDADSLNVCDGQSCRDIRTLHHGDQTDVLVLLPKK